VILISSVPKGNADTKFTGDQNVKEVAGAGSYNGAERNPDVVREITQDGVPPYRMQSADFCRSYQPEGRLMANPIASASV
jgi:hypothetical protein